MPHISAVRLSIPYRVRGFLALLVMGLPAIAGSLTAPGLHNFRQINQQVYRGAQPTNEGFKYLAKLGVKVVLDLREHDERSGAEQRMVTAAGMKYVNIPMTGLTPPTPEETKKVLALLENSSAGPVFVHCKRGADRTGSVIAAYRIHHDKWDNARALKEALDDGMGFRQAPRRDYIRAFRPEPADSNAAVLQP